MKTFQQINIEQAKQLMAEKSVNLVDIRDPNSYSQGHIKDAIHLSNENLQEFMTAADPNGPLIVYCYHGHSSQTAAQFLVDQGFDEVYSLIGGYTAWASVGS